MTRKTNTDQSGPIPERAPGEDRTAPIPDAVAEDVRPELDPDAKAGREVPDLAALGQAFVKRLPKEAREGRYRPRGSDGWIDRPVALADGWHHDEATKWNFLVRNGRLFEARSDQVMANAPLGTHGRAHRA